MGPDYWQNDYYDDTFKVNGKLAEGSTAIAPTSGSASRRKWVEKNKDQPLLSVSGDQRTARAVLRR